jgi:hypothetical protein
VLFQKRFHAGLRDGSITESYRVWSRPQVKPGGRYKTPAGMIEVAAIDLVKLSTVNDAAARRSGFDHRDELVRSLSRSARKSLRASSNVYRVKLRFAGKITKADLPPSDADWSADDLAAMTARLDKMDRLSRHGPWTGPVLRLIESRPQTAASKLAPTFQRETRDFKVDVRKLKKLGLTVSFDVGYALSERGRVFLERTRRR